jgi:hypothetical protein
MSKPNRAERVIAFLESRYPGWVPAIELEPVGGRQAWRTAVSEARAIVKGNGDDIENRVRTMGGRVRDDVYILSEYRLKKRSESLAPANSLPHQDGQDLREVRTDEASRIGHDLNEFSLR